MDSDNNFGTGSSGVARQLDHSGVGPSLPRPAVRPLWPVREVAEDPVFIRDHRGLQRIDRACIASVRAEGNYVEVHTAGRRYVLRNSLCEVIAQLGSCRFAQVNRNTAVNIHRLERVDTDTVELAGQVITLTRCFRGALLQRIHVLGGR